MMLKLSKLLLAGVALCLAAGTVRADQLDDSLQTVWESLWSQGGAPQFLVRWSQPVAYRIYGAEADSHRAQVGLALKAAAQATGIVFNDVSSQSDAETAAALQIEIVRDTELLDTMPCYTQSLKLNGWSLEKMQVKMRAGTAWQCTFHEMMHAMGIPGHPSGKTVLSYFPYRRDVFMDLDRLMLEAWYSPAMPLGATTLQALVVLSDAVVRKGDHGVAPAEAAARARAFNLRRFAEMQALASGKGEIPAIVLRSGRANAQSMQAARGIAAFFVGLAYTGGTIVGTDVINSGEWFQRSAKLGYTPGQLMWARALRQGSGVVADPLAAHGWLTLAHQRGNSLAKKEIEALEKKMSAEEIDKARAQPAPQLDPA